MRTTHPTRTPRARAFTIVELLVVIGIISVLISLLLPAVRRAMKQAKSVQCQSNLRGIGQLLIIYANNNQGVLYPIGSVVKPGDKGYAPSDYGTYRTLGQNDFHEDGSPLKPEERWPAYVFDPPQWNPKVMVCPEDPDALTNPAAEQHSYLLNHHLEESPQKMIKYGARIAGVTSAGEQVIRSPSEVVVMGEKRSEYGDYYMSRGEFDPPREIVELYRHGARLGSNYLYLDMHVSTVPPNEAKEAVDPWDPTPTAGTGP